MGGCNAYEGLGSELTHSIVNEGHVDQTGGQPVPALLLLSWAHSGSHTPAKHHTGATSKEDRKLGGDCFREHHHPQYSRSS